jgi:hypothetical protein
MWTVEHWFGGRWDFFYGGVRMFSLVTSEADAMSLVATLNASGATP